VGELFFADENTIMVDFLSLLDKMMIASAVSLIAGGSSLVYVKQSVTSRVFRRPSERPQAFQMLSPGTLKAKMAGSLAGISAVLILKQVVETMEADEITASAIAKVSIAVGVHLALLLSYFVFSAVEKMHGHHGAPSHGEIKTELDGRREAHTTKPATPGGTALSPAA
jgi:uncharacterized protein (TIGR00645 family)